MLHESRQLDQFVGGIASVAISSQKSPDSKAVPSILYVSRRYSWRDRDVQLSRERMENDAD
ncbi:hypothetical protein D3C78_1859670 [compost metagenome]